MMANGKYMNWRRWKLGLVISIACALFTAGAGLTAGMKWQAFVAVLSSALLSNLMNFLYRHPVETIADDPDLGPAVDPPPLEAMEGKPKPNL